MFDLLVNNFWDPTTPPPPINDTVGDYEIDSELKEPTNYSFIYLGNKQNDNETKVLKFVKCTRNAIYKVKNEIATMKIVDHPNIIKLEDCFIYNEYVCIVTPYYPLQSLHNFIIDRYPSGIPEKMACKIMYQVLNAVKYLHKNNIWHRDIKPDNLLVVNSDEKNPKVVLSDFGFARKFENEGSLCKEYLGTPEFTAPEIYKMGEYSNKVDIWSLGVSLFVMLTAKYPTCSFQRNPIKCRLLIERGLLNFDLLNDMCISNEAIDLVKKMCTLDECLRITAEDALNHSWIVKNININEDEIDNTFDTRKKDEYICD